MYVLTQRLILLQTHFIPILSFFAIQIMSFWLNEQRYIAVESFWYEQNIAISFELDQFKQFRYTSF